MATMSASFVAASTIPISRSSGSSKQIHRMSSFGGLKAINSVMGLGCSQCVDQQFAQLQARALKSSSRRGGALAAKASVSEEVFRVVPIMTVLVLVGVAVGFVLLRVEQAVEESEDG
ncbi:hypothetical protein SELMODRAFT_438339 [Selaginella moellendorffii]|uniref:Cytochrome b6-f complex subunit 7 n=1 Tax=Selaginella moellendorffii TaxID=88036 RepID=D8QW90_SELML|nr:uncharacterized protein LOC9643339 [Selaginella moellendorffii]EFJ36592.1 hypothetical protein SELMODRAFT_438339 [Selaginella moellendorffii]|eukprot:XP_024520376.1 uncharacterized protein LOC9643339 [Selaginella moellendorffii]